MTSPVIDNYFVCIGAQKSGTTWLARMLATHPDLFVTPVKEIHYFDHVAGITEHLSPKKRRSRYRKYHQRMWTQWNQFTEHRSQWAWYRHYMGNPIDDAWYAGLFHHRGPKRFAGEITPEYAILGRKGLAHIKRLSPDARVMFIMRNPVERTWSQVLHQCRVRGLDATRQSTDALMTMLAEPRFGELGDYAMTLDDMAAVFRPDQVLPLFYEEMHEDRLKSLQQVCKFIGAGFSPDYFSELGRRFNRSQEAALPEAVREQLRQAYRPQAEAVRQRLGRLPAAWRKEFGL
ncbi:MAG: sulfotransferase family protein [Hyphomicrobiaceae bacterium]